MLNARPMVAIEGTHGAGKTSLMRSLAALLGERGHLPEIVEDQGRRSSYIQDGTRGSSVGDVMLEVAIATARAHAELEAARRGQLVLCDRSVLAGLPYVDLGATSRLVSDSALYDTLKSFLLAYARRAYDLVILVDRVFDQRDEQRADPLRPMDSALQATYRERIRDLLTAAEIPILAVTEVEPSAVTASRLADELMRRGFLR